MCVCVSLCVSLCAYVSLCGGSLSEPPLPLVQVTLTLHPGALLVNPEAVLASGVPRTYCSTFDTFSRAVAFEDQVPLPSPAAIPAPEEWPSSVAVDAVLTASATAGRR
jgi:hypothetical protein